MTDEIPLRGVTPEAAVAGLTALADSYDELRKPPPASFIALLRGSAKVIRALTAEVVRLNDTIRALQLTLGHENHDLMIDNDSLADVGDMIRKERDELRAEVARLKEQTE